MKESIIAFVNNYQEINKGKKIDFHGADGDDIKALVNDEDISHWDMGRYAATLKAYNRIKKMFEPYD